MAGFSNWDDPNGGDDVDVAAPGVNVLSYYKNGELEYLDGTSMATPAVAGLLITGGLKEGKLVTPNAAGYSDPFAITTIDQGAEESPAPDPSPEPSPVPTPEASITYIGDAESAGDDFYLSNDDAYGAVSSDSIEDYLGLDFGEISTFSTEGSAIKVEYDFNVGDTISFDYTFYTEESDYGDFSFFSVDDTLFLLESVYEGEENNEYDGSFAYTFNQDSNYDLAFGVIDVVDTLAIHI